MNESAAQPVSFAREVAVAPRRLECALDDGYRTSVYYHAPAGPEVRLPVLQMHGIQSHPGWFVGSAAALAAAGHPVYQVTRRGSGDNDRDRGHADSWRELVDDVAAACGFVREHAGAPRVHLLGVSWGGKLLAAFAARQRGGAVASLTMVAPGLASRVDVPVGVKLAMFASLLARPRRLYDIPLADVDLFTDNPPMQDYLRGDRLTLHQATAKFFYVSRCLDWMLARYARQAALVVPTTLLLASRDRIIDNARTAELARRLTAGRCAVHELPGAHTLEFEPDPQPLYAAIVKSLLQG